VPVASAALVACLLVGGCGFDQAEHTARSNQLISDAIAARQKGNLSGADKLLDGAQAEAEHSDNAYQMPKVLRERSELALAMWRGDRAEQYVRKSLELINSALSRQMSTDQRSLLEEDQARASVLLGDSLMAQNKFGEAIAVYQGALSKSLASAGTLTVQDTIRHKISAALAKTGYKEKAKQMEVQTNDLNFESTIFTSSVKSLLYAGRTKMRARNYPDALIKYKRGRDHALQDFSSQPLRCTAMWLQGTCGIASVEFLLHETNLARQEAKEAVDRYEGFPDVQDHDMRYFGAQAYTLLALLTRDEDSWRALARRAVQSDAVAAVDQVRELHLAKNCGDIPVTKVDDLMLTLGPALSVDDCNLVLRRQYQYFLSHRKFKEGVAWFEGALKCAWFSADSSREGLVDEINLLLANGRAKESLPLLQRVLESYESAKKQKLPEMRGLARQMVTSACDCGELGTAFAITKKSFLSSEERGMLQWKLAKAAASGQGRDALSMYDSAIVELGRAKSSRLEEVVAEREHLAKGEK
jgi:tetratricopeptide (TPR) repeat protein